jgi:thiol-disulfide isomerase/thioredoxin
MRRLVTALAVVALAGIVAACSGVGSTPTTATGLVGQPAPALSGESLTGGGSVDLASMKGKPTVVVFWLNTCPHCQAFVPAFQAVWPQVADDANVLLAGMQHPDPNVPAGPGFETLEAFVATTGLTLPTIRSDLESATTTWDFDEVPAVYVLDGDHVVQKVLIGPDVTEVLEAISSL